MTTPFALTTCIVSIVAVGLLWLFPIAALLRDNFRSDIRRIRNDLFDFMWENGYSFDTPAYRDARQGLNGLLRASNCMSPATFMLSLFYYLWYGMDEDRKVADFSNCPPELRRKLEATMTAAIRRLEVLMFKQSLLGITIFLFFSTIVAAIKGRERIGKAIDAASRQLAADAFLLGAPIPELSLPHRSLLRC